MLKENQLPDCLHKQRLCRLDALLVILAVDAPKPKDVKTIRSLGRNAGLIEVLRWNISDALGRSKGLAIRLPEGWALTSRGKDHVRALGVVPSGRSPKAVNQAAQLRAQLTKIRDADTKAFVEESIVAFETGLLRACVVLSWSGAVSLLYDHVMALCLTDFNVEAGKRHPKWKEAKIKDDLARMKEADFLDIIGAPPLSVIGKSLKEELKNNCLQLRNACGHPSSLQFGESKVAAHLEILILNVFAKF